MNPEELKPWEVSEPRKPDRKSAYPKYKVNRWLDPETDNVLYGIDRKPARGEPWAHCCLGSEPMFFGTHERAEKEIADLIAKNAAKHQPDPIAAPGRAFRFTLRLDADSRDDLTQALESIATRIALNELTTGVSGGYGSGYSYELLSDPSQTHDKYFAELNAWLAAKRDSAQQEK